MTRPKVTTVDGDEYVSRDLATKLIGVKRLHDEPVGVPDLGTAAEILKVELSEVEHAAEHVIPWPHRDDPARVFYSIRQLARVIVRTRIQAGKPLPKQKRERVPAVVTGPGKKAA
jgi:hypothetical protein